jgi:hypothetical protein
MICWPMSPRVCNVKKRSGFDRADHFPLGRAARCAEERIERGKPPLWKSRSLISAFPSSVN